MYNKRVKAHAKQVLIIGGSSSLAETLIRFAKEESYEITATFRGNVSKDRDPCIKWINLELSQIESLEEFFDELSDVKYDRVLFLIGAVTNKYFLDMSHSEMLNYYSTYVVNSLYLLQKCLALLKTTSSIIVMSSRAGSSASYDVHYSAVKSALEAYVRSSGKSIGKNQSIVAISSGLIEGSKMYLDMKPEHQNSHKIRAGGHLITLNELCSQIWRLTAEETIENNGKIINLGPVY
jgi:NAD(P)-dependent dehydrogenase (short-subunit alcohol dehydrogenase family)